MIRAAGWTAGLFAVGAGVVHFFPSGAWLEPLLLAALGAGLILAGSRGEEAERRETEPRGSPPMPAAERAAR
jgi:hypothetical protein